MSNDDDLGLAHRLDHRGDVRREVVQAETVKCARTFAFAAGIGLHDAIPVRPQQRSQTVEIVGRPAKTRDQNQHGAVAREAQMQPRPPPFRCLWPDVPPVRTSRYSSRRACWPSARR